MEETWILTKMNEGSHMPNENLQVKWEKWAKIKSEPDKDGIRCYPLAILENKLVYMEWGKYKHPAGYFKIATKYNF